MIAGGQKAAIGRRTPKKSGRARLTGSSARPHPAIRPTPRFHSTRNPYLSSRDHRRGPAAVHAPVAPDEPGPPSAASRPAADWLVAASHCWASAQGPGPPSAAEIRSAEDWSAEAIRLAAEVYPAWPVDLCSVPEPSARSRFAAARLPVCLAESGQALRTADSLVFESPWVHRWARRPADWYPAAVV